MNDLIDHDDPMVRFIARRADALMHEARTHRTPEVVALYGEEAARRLAIGMQVAGKELTKLAQAAARGEIGE